MAEIAKLLSTIWNEQWLGGKPIRFGVSNARRPKGSVLASDSAFDYIVGEKLQNFAEASLHHREFARELPSFVSEVRRMFTPDEIETHLTDLERAQNEKTTDLLLDDDDPLPEDTSASVERARQFNLIKELLRASTLGTA
jgi:hypothetical protein